jgi:transcriptional regulator with PAS, ATPase and Fis domain
MCRFIIDRKIKEYGIESTQKPLSLEDMEKQMIRKTLEKHRGKRKAAADELKISERTLYRKIKEYGIE